MTSPSLTASPNATAETPSVEAVRREYRRLRRRRFALLLLLGLGIGVGLAVDLVTGPSGLSVSDAVRGLLGTTTDETTITIVRSVRLPSALLALLAGAALGLAGAEMQTALNNPLASPFTLGLSSWAVFGAALAIVGGVAVPGVPLDAVLPIGAFVFALLAVALLQAIARLRGAGVESLILFGTALFFSGNAAVALVQFTAGEQALQQLVFWTMGSVGRATPLRLSLLTFVLCSVAPFAFAAAWKLTALRSGDERARAFGIDVVTLRRWSLLRVALLTAAAVAFTGTIPFVGLVAPHIARLLAGEDHRFYLPASVIAGALVLSMASVLSKMLIPGIVVPIGIVTAMIGVPFFVVLLLTRGRVT